MKPIESAYINALLADASYVSVATDTGNVELRRRMTPALSDFLLANFQVRTSIETPNTINPIFGPGFDAVVWEGKSGSPYAGQTYVSMRGTQGLTDIADDFTLANRGIPYDQIRDMVNWWLKNTASSANTNVVQIKVVGIPGSVIGNTFALDVPTTGTGLLEGLDPITGVNGHSLGGYLATAFTRLFGNGWAVQAVNTFNSAGFSNLMTSNTDGEFLNLANLIGASKGLGSWAAVGAKQTNYYAQNGINVTTNSWADFNFLAPGFNQYGGRTALYQEDTLGVNPIANHSIYKQTDLLALGSALEKLDNSLTFAKLNAFIRAGSNDMKASYEGVLDGLRKTILGTANFATTEIGDTGPDNAPNRVDYQDKLDKLIKSDAFKTLSGKSTLSLATASNLASTVKTDFGAFLALSNLSPVVISTTDAAALAKLKQANQSLATLWDADFALSATERTQGKANFTDVYLADRQALLQGLVSQNITDKSYDIPLPGKVNANYTYTDFASNQVIKFRGTASNAGAQQAQQVMFGNDLDNTLVGSDAVAAGLGDRLYGGAGSDTINGLAGNDYLEGDAGNDTLDGGDGNYNLLGGAGIDTYTYTFTGAWGKDTILDSDGQGNLSINGELLSTTKATGKRGSWTAKLGGEFVGLSIFDDASSSTGQKLAISKADGTATITINNFDGVAAKSSAGYLGIKLDTTAKLALVENISSNVWQDYDFNASSLNGKSSNITEGTGKTFTVFLNAAAKLGDTITVALGGGAIESVAGHVRKQGFVAIFGSEKQPKKCAKLPWKVELQKSRQVVCVANRAWARGTA